MSSNKTTILLTGATGYIGGSIITRFLKRSDASSLDIRAIVRSPEKAERLKAFGITPIIGSHTDAELMEKACAEADVVITAADCDNVDAARYTLRGLKRRYEATGKKAALIHTSGTGVYVDWSEGKVAIENYYNDTDSEKMNALPDDAPHRAVDLEVLAGDDEGYVNTYIVLPPTIWGLAKGPLFEQGISHNSSIQIPALLKACLDRGRGGMVNAGKNMWSLVEIHELADLYNALFDAIQTNHPKATHGRHAGYYNAVYEEYSGYEVAEKISKVLVELGKGKSAKPLAFTDAELTKYFGPFAPFFGTNSRGIADHSKLIGWTPTKGKAEFLASIKPETEAIIRAGSAGAVGAQNMTIKRRILKVFRLSR